ncbi:hypothetical protein Tco_0757711 [Tanacetum coccineum]
MADRTRGSIKGVERGEAMRFSTRGEYQADSKRGEIKRFFERGDIQADLGTSGGRKKKRRSITAPTVMDYSSFEQGALSFFGHSESFSGIKTAFYCSKNFPENQNLPPSHQIFNHFDQIITKQLVQWHPMKETMPHWVTLTRPPMLVENDYDSGRSFTQVHSRQTNGKSDMEIHPGWNYNSHLLITDSSTLILAAPCCTLAQGKVKLDSRIQ